MGLPSEQIKGLRLAGLLHDIGKIAIPAEILSKPSRLTEAEFNIVKDHPQIGHDIIKSVEFPWPIADIVLQHHELLDGSGYPVGLKDGKIRLEAKIMVVADVVEAMSSHRPYRPAHSLEMTLEEISKYRGILYDEDIVDICLKLFLEKAFRFNSNP
jgi:putative nucleotidyltransferase with HDIG domain